MRRRALTFNHVTWGQLAAAGRVLTRFRDGDAYVCPHDPVTRPHGNTASSIAFPTQVRFYQLSAEVNDCIIEYVWRESRGVGCVNVFCFSGWVGGGLDIVFSALQSRLLAVARRAETCHTVLWGQCPDSGFVFIRAHSPVLLCRFLCHAGQRVVYPRLGRETFHVLNVPHLLRGGSRMNVWGAWHHAAHKQKAAVPSAEVLDQNYEPCASKCTFVKQSKQLGKISARLQSTHGRPNALKI